MGICQGDRVGVLLPNCAAIPLSYFATQKIGAVTVILDARLKGKELQGVLKDAAVKLLIVHQQLRAEADEAFKELGRIPIWVVNGEGDESFEKKFSAPAAPASLPQLRADDDVAQQTQQAADEERHHDDDAGARDLTSGRSGTHGRRLYHSA